MRGPGSARQWPGGGRRGVAAATLAALATLTMLAALTTAARAAEGGAGGARSAPLTAAELAGKRLYLEGVAASGATVTARVGMQGAPMPATLLPCANCHGTDGQGRPEGGIRPPAITWQELAKPYGHHHDPGAGGSGRRHPPFDEAAFARAITEGIDPGGNRLDPAMPRYTLAASDLRDLIAYLKRIDSDLDPGLAPDRLRLALVLHDAVPGAAGTRAVSRAVVQEAVAGVNGAGGIHGRQIDLVEVDGGATVDTLKAALAALAQRDVFAVLMPQEAPAGIEWDSATSAGGLPLVAGFAPPAAAAPGGIGFFALGGLGEEIAALTRSVPAQTGLLGVLTMAGDDVAERALHALDARQRQAVVVRTVGGEGEVAGAVEALQHAGSEAVLVLLPPAPLAALLRAAEARRWAPRLLVPLRHAGPLLANLPAAWSGRVSVSMAAAPDELGAAARSVLAAVRARVGSSAHPLSQTAALASAQVLFEGLKRSGRRASRTRLAESLAGLSEFPTGVGPLVSFGPTRRVGAVGVHVLQLGAGGRVASARLVRLDRE